MMTAAFLAAALAAGPAQGLPPKPSEVDCGVANVRKVTADQGRLKKMSELPPANLELTVDRRIGQCQVPVIVVRDVEQPRAATVRREGAPSRRR